MLALSTSFTGDAEASIAFERETIATEGDTISPALHYVAQEALAIWLCAVGDFEAANEANRKAVLLKRRMGDDPWRFLFVFVTQAACEVHAGNHETAAILFSVFERLDAQAPETAVFWPPIEVKVRDDTESAIRSALGDEALEDARKIGSSLTLERALDLSLGRALVP